jgi:hypothetical protein
MASWSSSTTTPTSTSFSAVPAFLYSIRTLSLTRSHVGTRTLARKTRTCAKLGEKSALQYKKLGDSDLAISEITFGTVRILHFLFYVMGNTLYLIILNSQLVFRNVTATFVNFISISAGLITDIVFLKTKICGLFFILQLYVMFQMTFGEQNTEKEAHEMLSYAFERGINALDTSEAVSSFS